MPAKFSLEAIKAVISLQSVFDRIRQDDRFIMLISNDDN
jgi:hypothetical protein